MAVTLDDRTTIPFATAACSTSKLSAAAARNWRLTSSTRNAHKKSARTNKARQESPIQQRARSLVMSAGSFLKRLEEPEDVMTSKFRFGLLLIAALTLPNAASAA